MLQCGACEHSAWILCPSLPKVVAKKKWLPLENYNESDTKWQHTVPFCISADDTHTRLWQGGGIGEAKVPWEFYKCYWNLSELHVVVVFD